MSAVLNGRDLTVVRHGRRILDEVTVTLTPGVLTAIVGPNGSGKSTLLRVLAGVWPLTDGVVTLDGDTLLQMPQREVARRLSFLPQETRCDFAFTVEEIVAMGRHPHRGRFAAENVHDREAVHDALTTCDLLHLRVRNVTHLSGGERQRVALARCLAAHPDVLLLDEPTAQLDLEHTVSLLKLCRALAIRGTTVVIATHDIGNVARFAAQVVLLHGGHVVASGLPASVLTPARLRTVFLVDTQIVTTPDGNSAFIFDVSSAAPGAFAEGAHR